MAFNHIRDARDKQVSNQASKKTDFTVDLIWWGLLRLAPISTAIMVHNIGNFEKVPSHNFFKFSLNIHT